MSTTPPTSEIITPKSLYTITGAAGAVWLFGSMLYTVLGPRIDEVIYRSIAFGLSLIIALGMLLEKKSLRRQYKSWLLIIPNSALIFINASGFNAVNTGGSDESDTQSEKKSSLIGSLTSPPNDGSIQKASFLPFLKDVAWWPDPLLKEKVEVLKEINDSLKTENTMLRKNVNGLGKTDSLAIKESNNKIASLETQIAALQLENTTLKTGNINNSDLTTTIEKLNANINSLHKQLNDKDAQLKTCNVQLQQAKNDLAATNAKLNDCLKRGGSNDELNNRINSLNAQLDQNKKNLNACENKLTNAENTIKSLTTQLKNCNTKPGDPDGSPVVLDLQDKVRSLEKELSIVRSQLIKCQGSLANSGNNTNLQNQVNDLQGKLNNCEGQLEKYNSMLNNFKSSLGQCNSQLRSVRDSLSSCQKKGQVIRTVPKTN